MRKKTYNADLLKTVGEKIKTLRRIQNVTQAELAFIAELDRAYLSAIENGKNNVTIGLLEHVARGLGVKMKELFGEI